MSAKIYQEAWEHMSEKEKDLLGDLWDKAINWDGHSWVTYGDIERVVGTIIMGRISEN